MTYALRAITAEELKFNLNPNVKIQPNAPIGIKYNRNVRQANEKIWQIMGEIVIESTEAQPCPYNLKVRLVGTFEADGIESDLDKQELTFNMEEALFPYLRTAITNLTTTAFMPPLVLPLSPTNMTPVKKEEAPANPTLN